MDGIAIIGMSGRFPGAGNVQTFWENLVAGVESVSRFTDAELEMQPAAEDANAFVNARGIVENADLFDAAFFGYNAREAALLDPQHRVFLECAWEAIESAGYDLERYVGLIGVWAGSGINSYLLYNLATDHEYLARLVGGYQQGESAAQFSNDRDFLATRVSYKLNLRGPSMTVQTACSTSLVAVVQACQALWSYQTDMALAGGVSITFPQRRGYAYQEGAIASADGRNRTFDAGANGTVFSSGAGIVLLKRLEEAQADGDRIIAVIRGAAVNNDGANKVSFTAPSVDGQAEVIQMAQAVAGISPNTITYVEAHGTATPLGDPIEFASLTQAFRAGGADKNGYCAIASLKSNVGHMDIASGVAGLIKTALALQHRKIPPSLHYQTPNPHLSLDKSPFFVNDRLLEWNPPEDITRRAGVSSFGVGGTNAHAVLEEATTSNELVQPSQWVSQLYIISARTETGLETATVNLAQCLQSQPTLNAVDVAHTLQTGRRAFGCRRIVTAESPDEAATALEKRDSTRVFTQLASRAAPPVVFLFPGQGAQRVNMGRGLYETEGVFRDSVDRCAELLRPWMGGEDLRHALFPVREEIVGDELRQTRLAQPALFIFGYALAQLWMSWGIKPSVMLGHSVGEYVAATLAGVFKLEDALMLIARRAQLVQEQATGVMLAVRLSEREILELLREDGISLSLAAVNAPNLCVLAGTEDAVLALEPLLEAKSVGFRRLNTSHAFHSAMLNAVVAPFEELVKSISLQTPTLPFISNLTGRWITPAEATDARYWARQLRETVRFNDGIGELVQTEPDCILLEIGPTPLLGPLARQNPATNSGNVILPSLQENRDDSEAIQLALGRLWLEGVTVDWAALHHGSPRKKVLLPTYPFERQRYWIEPGTESGTSAKPLVTPAPVESQSSIIPTKTMTMPANRKPAIVEKIKTVLKNLSGQDQSTADPGMSFLELGFDSLLLTQVAQALRKEFGVKVTFRQLLEDQRTIAAVSEFLDAQMPEEVAPASTPANAAARENSRPLKEEAVLPRQNGSSEGKSLMERVIQDQLRVMTQQLEMLRGGLPPIVTPLSEKAETTFAGYAEPTGKAVEGTRALPSTTPKAFGPYRPIEKGTGGGLTTQQQQHLDALIARYNRRTAGSKRQTQVDRARFSDPRTVSSFRPYLKEAVYPVIVERSAGSRLWDIDGNEYVDLTMGFGTNLLGHSPAFITAALEKQLRAGIEVGPSSPLAGKVAALLCEMTGSERAAFTNTGSEAVLAAVRMARTVSGRTRIATTGGFHGINDEVLVRGVTIDGVLRGAPIAPGIPEHAVRDVVVVEYGTEQGLETLRAHAHELACLLIEPVQSRKPGLQPREFLHAAREITAAAGCALVFDEIITGFRCHPGGAQAYFGVRADLMTYGKIIGGGMPIGAVCGKAEYMDALDGGAWQYGDGSFPEVGVTFFAGTYIRHPLTMAAAWAILNYLRSEGGGLQQKLNERTARMVEELNAFFAESGVPVRLDVFSSWFYPHFDDKIKYGGLLYFHLRDRGIHAWEGRPCFLSTAHTEEDVRFIVRAFKESVREMQTGGFLPGEPLPDREVSSDEHRRTDVLLRSATKVGKRIGFSLYYFGNYPAPYTSDKYRLILESAKYADDHDFDAVWLPERHFHSVGGFSPNPSLLAAALARDTRRIALRGGSVVLPLHHPVRVAEEWAVVDNLSQGRVGISIASGWHPNDFVFSPERFPRRREIMLEDLETIQKLWRGESLAMRAGAGSDFEVRLFPLPLQKSLPVWLTCIHEESFVRAGQRGVGVLGYLMNQGIDELAHKITRYREAYAEAGHDPKKAQVTVLVHTFLGKDLMVVREQARLPLRDYLRSYLDNSQKRLESQAAEVSVEQDDIEYLLDKSFDDYMNGKALIGTPDSCADVVEKLREIGVDEIGCFIDFGVDPEVVLASLPTLNSLRERFSDNVHSTEIPAPTQIPLGKSQAGLWIVSQTDLTASRAYNESNTLRIDGLLNVDAVRRALEGMMTRHEALRTTISCDGESQTIHPEMKANLVVCDLSKHVDAEQSVELESILRKMEGEDFDFGYEPPIRAQLVRLNPEHHLLTLTFHHLLGNGPSYWGFLEDFTALLQAEHTGTSITLPPALQLSEYLAWHRAASVEEAAADEAFWRGQFSDGVPMLELPTDRVRPSHRSHRGGREILMIPRELTVALRKTAAAQRTSLFTILLAGFDLLLHRLSGQSDLVVGSSFEGETRSLPGGERLFANTTNVVPLRSQVNADTCFTDLLASTKERVFAVHEHQNFFFGRLTRLLGLPHDSSRPPIFSAFFNYENGKFQREIAPGLTVELVTDGVPYRSPRNTAMFDLYLNVAEADGELRCEVDHSTDLYDGSTVTRWFGYYRTMLKQIVANPERNIWEFALLADTERTNLLRIWNDTAVEYPLKTSTLHGLIEAQVKHTPDAPAVIFEGETISYQRINRRANKLANYLLGLGVRTGAMVGVYMERSVEMVVALLGVMKVGAAYLPLDPDYPADRLDFMLADAQAPVILTQAHLKAKLSKQSAQVLCLDDEWATIKQSDPDQPNVIVGADDLAYVIYTSGSTGRPKGVMNTHRGICNRLLWMQDAYQLTAKDRVLQKTPFSFDVSVWEFFWPLLTGAALVLARPRAHGDSAYLAALIQEQSVTTMHFVPPMLAAFLEEPNLASQCTSLCRVICSGEALAPELAERFFSAFPGDLPTMHNLYGPTEAAVDVTYWQCVRGDMGMVVPIGRPIANTQIYILDERSEPTPIGIPGELYIGGIGVARGYLNRPELTSERFIPDPFGTDPKARLYKTGDLACWRADGAILYLGRMDHQVKVRGFRIELGEIESVLNSHPQVRESVMTLREDKPGDRRLAAYIVQNTKRESDSANVDPWQEEWEAMHLEGIAAAATGEGQSPIAALLEGMHAKNLQEQERECVDQTLARIRALKPSHVLEIGVGTGDFALALTDECARYVATDYSPAAVKFLRARGVTKLELRCQAADDFTGIEPGEFDTVIIHSVSQYLQHVDYFRRVLAGAVRTVRPGGCVYVGDVQSYALLEAYHCGTQLRLAPDALPTSELRERIRWHLAREMELTVDPSFFHEFHAQTPAVGAVELQLRRGREPIEMTKYHYDVFLHVGEKPKPVQIAEWIPWQTSGLNLSTLRVRLEQDQPVAFALRGVPNARVMPDVTALCLVKNKQAPDTTGELRQAVSGTLHGSSLGVDPESLWDLGESLGYAVAINWSADAAGRDAACDVIFYRGEGLPVFPSSAASHAPAGHGWTNQPWRETASIGAANTQTDNTPDLVSALRHYCRERLPEYMVPAAFVVLDSLPLTSNGKTDRRALPAPDFSSSSAAGVERELPGTLLEKHLATLWSEILGLAIIGREDNFFECGGDSLLGLRMANRLRKTLGENISLVAIFDAPTIRRLANFLEKNHPVGVAKLIGNVAQTPDAMASPAPSMPGIVAVSREGRKVRRSSLASES